MAGVVGCAVMMIVILVNVYDILIGFSIHRLVGYNSLVGKNGSKDFI